MSTRGVVVALVAAGLGSSCSASIRGGTTADRAKMCVHPTVEYFTGVLSGSGLIANSRARVRECVLTSRSAQKGAYLEESKLSRCLVKELSTNETGQRFIEAKVDQALARHPDILSLESCMYMDCLYPERQLADKCLQELPEFGPTRTERVSIKKIRNTNNGAFVGVAVGRSDPIESPRAACENADEQLAPLLALAPGTTEKRAWRYYTGTRWLCVKFAYSSERAAQAEPIVGQLPITPLSIQQTQCTLRECLQQRNDLRARAAGECRDWRLATMEDYRILPNIVIPRNIQIWLPDREQQSEGTDVRTISFQKTGVPTTTYIDERLIRNAILICGNTDLL